MKALSVDHINKYFREPVDFQVLKDISFDVNRGEFVAIIGKSGSGKSTLLYLLSTMDTDYEGTISINGTKVTGQKQNQLAAFRNEHIGFVFQFHFLLPEFSVLDNVMMPALKLKKKSREKSNRVPWNCSACSTLKGTSTNERTEFQVASSRFAIIPVHDEKPKRGSRFGRHPY